MNKDSACKGPIRVKPRSGSDPHKKSGLSAFTWNQPAPSFCLVPCEVSRNPVGGALPAPSLREGSSTFSGIRHPSDEGGRGAPKPRTRGSEIGCLLSAAGCFSAFDAFKSFHRFARPKRSPRRTYRDRLYSVRLTPPHAPPCAGGQGGLRDTAHPEPLLSPRRNKNLPNFDPPLFEGRASPYTIDGATMRPCRGNPPAANRGASCVSPRTADHCGP